LVISLKNYNMGEIFGGATFWARQTIESEVFTKKPAMWFKIWFYIVSKVNHRTNSSFERGTNYFSFPVDGKIIGCSIDQWKKCISWLRHSNMIGTELSTRGILIKVLSYAKYQELRNYTSTTEAPQKHLRSTTINKNERMKEEENNNSKELLKEKKENINSWFFENYWNRKQDILTKLHEKQILIEEKELDLFFLYWTEPSKTGVERWKMQKTFEVLRRIITWLQPKNFKPKITNNQIL
jgi:hypothetical protein